MESVRGFVKDITSTDIRFRLLIVTDPAATILSHGEFSSPRT